ncbi:copper chaperone PCu(A)C [Thalassotalea montiporae]
MKFFVQLITAVTLFTASFHSVAKSAEIVVEDAYVREVIPGNSVTSAYMTITNQGGQAIKLVAAKSDDIPLIEIHEHTMHDGMMKMGQVAFVEIDANAQVKLQPMGLHLMMFDLEQPLVAGQQIAVTLVFDNNTSLDVNLPVRSIKTMKKQAKHHHH